MSRWRARNSSPEQTVTALSASQLREVFDSLPIGVIIASSDVTQRWENRSVTQLF